MYKHIYLYMYKFNIFKVMYMYTVNILGLEYSRYLLGVFHVMLLACSL